MLAKAASAQREEAQDYRRSDIMAIRDCEITGVGARKVAVPKLSRVLLTMGVLLDPSIGEERRWA